MVQILNKKYAWELIFIFCIGFSKLGFSNPNVHPIENWAKNKRSFYYGFRAAQLETFSSSNLLTVEAFKANYARYKKDYEECKTLPPPYRDTMSPTLFDPYERLTKDVHFWNKN